MSDGPAPFPLARRRGCALSGRLEAGIFRYWPALEEADLSGNAFEGPLTDSLAGLKHLKRLNVS
jgi:hypothetical protein